jgi:CubicO group peptidase (beta-lactamase class C family)
MLAISVVSLLAVASPESIVRGDVGQRVDEYFTRLEKFGWSGAALVAWKGEVVLEKGWGFADRDKKIPFTEDTVSSIGSVTKQFTGAAIVKLEMQGKLRVEDPLSKFFPAAPPDKAAITIHQLLTHTSGLGDLELGDDDTIGRDEMLRLAFASPLHAKPGAQFEYSNLGFSVAAAIVEVASGKSYEQVLHDELFAPAGMTSTGYLLPKWNRDRMAHGYDAQGRDVGTFENRNWGAGGPGWVLMGNGGILSTPRDMYRWHVALAGESVLSKAAKEKLQKPYVPTHAGDVYAYGWGVEKTPRGTTLVWHNGGNGIFFTDFRRYVDEDAVAYVNSNGAVRATEIGARQLPALMFGGEVAMPPRVVPLDAARAAALEGHYATAAGDAIEVARDGDGFTLSGRGDALVARLGGLQPPGAFPELEARVRRVVENQAKGDFEAVHEAMGPNAPPVDRIRANQTAIWKRWRDSLGEFSGVDLVGASRKGAVRVVARLRFERGSQTMGYEFMGPELAGILPLDGPATLRVLPTSDREFAWFDPQQPKPTIVRFEIGNDGRATSLTLSTSVDDVTARRAP